ncbi:cell wall-active antibiotics response protein LiaF [Paenibacillus puldeungensis]|uniref:Cell wall-active antibiotics response protein LiaF n=1 Tax=Paenibacillus puldeungensis TaxID=696536 RepID=A0ABW3S1Z0_9BACL
MRNGVFGRLIGGMVLIGIGGVFLLNQLGITDISIGYLFSTYWPVFLILAGLANLANGNWRGGSFIGSLILFLIGGYFLARNLDIIYLEPGDFFKFFIPIILISCGLYVLFKPHGHRPHSWHSENDLTPPTPPMEPPVPPTFHPEMKSNLDDIFNDKFKQKGDSDFEKKANQERPHFTGTNYKHMEGNFAASSEVINKSGFIGDVHIGQDYFQLKPMNISHFIGDTVIDLTKAQIPYGETKINVSSFIGDVKVFIPEDMDVGIVATSSSFIGDLKVLKQKEGGFMSSVSVQSPYYGEANKKIKLVVSVFIGDVKVNMVG